MTAALLLLAGFVREKGEDCPVVGKCYKLLLAVMIFGVVCVIWTSLYGTFSVVGAAAIDGVQARYYIPLMLPFLYLFGNRKLVWKGSRVWYYRVLFLGGRAAQRIWHLPVYFESYAVLNLDKVTVRPRHSQNRIFDAFSACPLPLIFTHNKGALFIQSCRQI